MRLVGYKMSSVIYCRFGGELVLRAANTIDVTTE